MNCCSMGTDVPACTFLADQILAKAEDIHQVDATSLKSSEKRVLREMIAQAPYPTGNRDRDQHAFKIALRYPRFNAQCTLDITALLKTLVSLEASGYLTPIQPVRGGYGLFQIHLARLKLAALHSESAITHVAGDAR